MVDAFRVIAAKAEANYGVDATPDLADNAVLTRNYSTTPLEVDQLERNLDNQRYGATKGKPTNKRIRTSYEVELAGSGAAGTAPRWMELLRGCAMKAPVLVADTSATQNFCQPADNFGSLSEYGWVDDQLRKALGQRGTFTLDFTAGQVPFASLQMLGLLPAADPRETDAPDEADFSDWVEPLEVNDDNSVLTLGGFAAVTRSLQIQAAVDVNLRNLIGARYVRAGNHKATARLVCEAPTIAAKDYLSNLDDGDLIALALTHGTAAGNIVELAAPKAQITAISESSENDILMFNIDLLLTTDGGSTDLSIIAK